MKGDKFLVDGENVTFDVNDRCFKMSTEQDTLTSEASKDMSSSDLVLSQPWDKLLGESPAGNNIPKIIRTRPSFEIPRNDNAISLSTTDPNSLSPNVPPPPGVGRLTRTQSLGARRPSNGLLGNFHKQLRFSLRGDRGIGKEGPFFRYRQARYASRRVRKRVVFKHGDCNVVQGNVAKRRKRYLQDLFTTLVDAQWRWTLLVFAMSFLLSWLGFALVWWLIAYAHGDLGTISSPGNDTCSNPPPPPPVCVGGVNSFTTSFLFSVETQHTIGYGGRSTTDECPEAIFVMCLQSIVGVFIQAFMVGIVFAKLSRPKKRTQTLLFSQSAVICQRDGELVFMFRVGDMRKSHIIEAHVRAQMIMKKVGLIFAKLARAKKRTTTLLFSRNAVVCLRDGEFCLLFRVGDIRKSHILEAHVRAQIIRKKVTKEGELLPFYQQELRVGADGEEDRLMFIWPTTIVHKINENSPLYNLSASDMLRERFEIVVMLEGVIESTGMTTQARSSYLPSEIFWGHRFEPIVAFKKETGEYEVDYTLFNNTYEVDTPLCSAKQLDDLRKAVTSPSKLERLAVSATIPVELGPSPSNDTLDSCSVDSMSLDEHIEIKIPEARVQENRKLMEQQLNPSNQHHHHHHHHHARHPNGNIVYKQNGDVPHVQNGGVHSQNGGVHTQNGDDEVKRPSSVQNGIILMNGHHRDGDSKTSLKSRSVENTNKLNYGSNSHLYNFYHNSNEQFSPHLQITDNFRNGTNGNHIRMYRTPSGHLTPRAMTETPPPLKISIDSEQCNNTSTPADVV